MPVFSCKDLILIVACALLVNNAMAQDEPVRIYSKIRIYKQGDMYGGCSDPGVFQVPGQWLALRRGAAGWELVPAQLQQTQDGTLTSDIGNATYYLDTATGLHSGPVSAVPLPQRKKPSVLWTQTRFHFGGKPWAFVEWGGYDDTYFLDDGRQHYAINRREIPLPGAASDGESGMNQRKLVEMVPTALKRPVEAGNVSFMKSAREDDSSGAALAWAGDLDHDGRLDLIIEHSAKELWGSSLWLSAPAGAGGSIMVEVGYSHQGCS